MQISKKLRVAALAPVLVLGLAVPALAQSRDSDGDVISVIVYQPKPIPGGGYVYFTLGTETDTRFAVETVAPAPDTVPVAGTGAALPPEVSIAGTTYAVENDSGNIFLRAPDGGGRIAANIVSVSGKRVNPQAFALD